MSLEKQKDSLELSTMKSYFPRLDNESCVKTNVNVIKVAKLGSYFSHEQYKSQSGPNLFKFCLKGNNKSKSIP